MDSIRVFITVLLLVFSGQSLALFMPAGFQASADVSVVSSEEGC